MCKKGIRKTLAGVEISEGWEGQKSVCLQQKKMWMLLSGTGDLVTKRLEKARHSLPFLLWVFFVLGFWFFFFGGKVRLHRFLILLAKFV